MAAIAAVFSIDWHCRRIWRAASKNAARHLPGCIIGDAGTNASFRFTPIHRPAPANLSGLLASIALETSVLATPIGRRRAFRTAVGKSIIAKATLATVMTAVDRAQGGGAVLTCQVVPIMPAAGFVTPLAPTYRRFAAPVQACH